MKISIITVVYNRVATIEFCIQSVLAQTYADVEYIVVDGSSTDGTLDKIKPYQTKIHKIISEKDEGMYDALNKGIRMATGDVVGILHADDSFASNNIIEKIAQAFLQNQHLDCIYGDIAFTNSQQPDKVIRYYSSQSFKPSKLSWGYIPAHPSFFCKKNCFEKYGYYKTGFDIAADFELLLRFFKIHGVQSQYLPLRITNMSIGGKSTNGISSTIKINRELMKACTMNGVSTNYFKLYLRYLIKWKEFFVKQNSIQ